MMLNLLAMIFAGFLLGAVIGAVAIVYALAKLEERGENAKSITGNG
jgi:hypothetical protein